MKLKDTPAVDIVAILDRSGSMSSIIDDSIGGFNTFLEEQQKLEGSAHLSVVLFDHEYSYLYDDVPLADVKPLTRETYSPRGSTALNDAIGTTLTKMLAKNPEKAIVCILTDGQENTSTKFTASQVKGLVERAQGKGWQVVFLAANQDAFATGGSLGIAASGTRNFVANSEGTRMAYASASLSTTDYRSAN